ncbi:MAG: hypothetical protein HN348_00465 [Proteobacteria bacterium]|jgi:hypothetical protein|nr:hypothetical protein [Pseudomonadota bacterium]
MRRHPTPGSSPVFRRSAHHKPEIAALALRMLGQKPTSYMMTTIATEPQREADA